MFKFLSEVSCLKLLTSFRKEKNNKTPQIAESKHSNLHSSYQNKAGKRMVYLTYLILPVPKFFKAFIIANGKKYIPGHTL